MNKPVVRKLRCAVYTRKSTEEGLEMEFNSLDAQREACESYVASQKAEGWLLVPDRYDDGGYSGGNMERPGLKRLMADIEARRIDIVVVYKIDRLTRALMDFTKLIEVFDRNSVTFVSVTQAFNTTTSMGRLMLNVLLSFAQFEREVTGERIRDKFAASRKKGMWMGGWAPLGYDVRDRKLVVNAAEAVHVRFMFERFARIGSVTKLIPILAAESIKAKSGKPVEKGYLYRIISNPVYVGEAAHKGTSYPGEHKAIIDRALWNRVQDILKESPCKRAAKSRARTPALLKGLIFGPSGTAMTPSHTRRNGKLYRYTGAPRRRVARLSEIPAEARPLVDLLIEQRLLSTDVAKDNKERTVEPAHEALLRQWGLLQGWLMEDAPLLTVFDGIKREARDWAANGKATSWLAHTGERLRAAERLLGRPDLAANLEPTDKDYVASCQRAEQVAQARARRAKIIVGALGALLALGGVGWWKQSFLEETFNWYWRIQPYVRKEIHPYVLTREKERALKPKDFFRECAKDCPEMIVIAAGEFMMGWRDRAQHLEQHKVTIAKPFAVSKFDVTFADWDTCVSVGKCPHARDFGWGRDTKPVIDVSWDDAQQYVAWLSLMTGQPYRLLTEAEWEYAARAGTTTPYFWGSEIGEGNANCNGCGSQWDNRETSPVGSFMPNAFGLYDMAGNVVQWVQDCVQRVEYYNGAPDDGSAWSGGDCIHHVVRGGHFRALPRGLRSASRSGNPTGGRGNALGFRVARTLSAEPDALTVAPGEHY